MKEFGNFIMFLFMLAVLVVTLAIAVLFTSFAGSGHGSPTWFLVFIGLTQGIPIVTYGISFLIVAFGVLLGKQLDKPLSILGWSVAVYAFSFAVIFSLGSFSAPSDKSNWYNSPNPSFKRDWLKPAP